ncbi:zinc ribbon domain-containing protein [Halostella sp. PRR32]|uniref:zinc ribbon domain-containing protein n=1 Tax=Halostella sp. PRR32 TaxID=3098147 RepID=UPI00110ED9B2|nr:zinc ribbon domain-containing protein [Halostella sp. PRR32]
MRSERLRREIDQALQAGWAIEDESPDRVVLVNRNYGDLGVHVVIALLTAWWSFGVLNAVYAAYKYLNDSQRRVLWESARACPNCGEAAAADAEFCRTCGEKLPHDSDGPHSCPECGVVLADGARYCRNCGSEVGTRSATGQDVG